MTHGTRSLGAATLAVAAAAAALLSLTCGSPGERATSGATSGAAQAGEPGAPPAAVPPLAAGADRAAAAAAWDVVYGVLQHPRCANCHPAGDVPLQGDAMLPHAQLVPRGPDGHGLFGQRCDTCHQATNLDGPHLPPGVPRWHMPRADMPLVFVGVGKRELCEQMRDPARNGGKSPQELLEHMTSDPLVLWGWDPGNGRAPVLTPHADVVAAMRTWVEHGCGCPDD